MGRVFSVLLALLCLAACAIPPDDDEVDNPSSEGEPTFRLAANKLSAAKLRAARLGDGTLASATANLSGTQDGREVLSYVMSCALGAGDSLSVPALSAALPKQTVAGSIGLAPKWKTQPLSAAEKRWVSACVLSRTNLYGVEVKLSMRGSASALGLVLGESLGYLLVEGAFYGDLFKPQPEMYACSSLLKETGLPFSTLSARACSVPAAGTPKMTACGFTYTGACGVLDLGVGPACTGLGAPYAHCRGGTRYYDEVITVSLSTL